MNLDRWQQFNYFWDVISPSLSSPERQVWLAIFRHADTFGIASVTRSRIGAMLGVTPKAVSDGIKGLYSKNLLEKIQHGYGYKLCVTSNENVTPSNENVTPSNEIVTADSNEIVTPPSRKGYYSSNEKVITPVTKSLHNTEQIYRTDIQNRYTEDTNVEEEPKKTKQAKLPKTSKGDWKAKASATFLFDAIKLYPAERRVYRPKEFQAIWDEAAKEEGGYDVLWNIVREHLKKAIPSHDWTKEGGRYIPGMKKYIEERKYRAPIVEKYVSPEEALKAKLMEAHNFDELD